MTKEPTLLCTSRGRCTNGGFTNQEGHATALHGVHVDLFNGFAKIYILFAFDAEATSGPLDCKGFGMEVAQLPGASVSHRLYRIPV